MEIGLVSCTKQKREQSASPEDLYSPSTYFSKARNYATRSHDKWYILSAKHGLLRPDGPPIEPYDMSLSDLTADERRSWAEEVMSDLIAEIPDQPEITVVLHTGKQYYENLLPLFDEAEIDYRIPTKGLQFGETLRWYTSRETETQKASK